MAMLSSTHVSIRKRQPATPGELVQRARLKKGLTQEELAARIGKHVTTVQNLEGDRSSSRTTVEAVARELDETPESLGFQFRKPIRASEMTDEQRALVDEVLSLPSEDQETVRKIMAALRAKKRGKR